MTNEEESTAVGVIETTSASNIDIGADINININRRRQQAYDYTKSVLLGQQIKTTLSDGRNLTGTLICIDRLKNLILINVKEERLIDPLNYKYRVNDDDNDDSIDDVNNDKDKKPLKKKVFRLISQAMIPGSQLVKVEIANSKLRESQIA
mmetsp:Transcript_15388/g.17304  ORF Transcript_15388/g.17304 Transcript_15388/m.17304 type:complete len:150 (+) Transcript_15388:61-510(+)|eukprot:CAMPEP_0170796862 /NCGR_PEP_ID=MMETSP0733-20121128/25175_1 /TAXON_ID=186038 /ORGANISM="Fragilariopsis kerguelensis, Strain L26-C5" /LENGTH=149 /DNA_ID=CAMNT_0011147429 /DNA_START=17 /DNA_END=466 /DNA_ORIENTATION=+